MADQDVEQLKQMLQGYGGLLGAFEPSEADKRSARANALLAAGLATLTARHANPWQAIGQGGLLGLGAYNNDLRDIQAQRMQNLQAAAALTKMQKDAQLNGMAMDMLNGGNVPGGALGAQFGNSPVAGGPPAGGPPMQPQGLPMGGGNPRAEIAFALLGKKDVADVLHRQYQVTQGPQGTLIRNGQVVGQVLPQGMVIDGKFQPLPKEATDAMIEYESRKAGAVKAGEAPYTFTEMRMPGGGSQELTAEQKRQFLTGGSGGLPMSTPNAGPVGQVPSAADTAQNTEIQQGFGKTYLSMVDAERNAPATIGKMQLLKDYLSKVETGKMAPSVLALKAYASYIAPDLAKEWTADVPYAQAAQAMSREMALQLRNPSGGAGMPGNLSDADRNYLESMTASAANDPRAIPMLVDARIRLEQRNQKIGEMAREYRQKNGKVDEGFFRQVSEYANANPLFKDMGPVGIGTRETAGVIGGTSPAAGATPAPAGTDKTTGRPLYRRPDGKLYFTP